MRFRTDDRGVTVQIGTVLLFAVLIVLLSTYQATVVPQQNEQVEFNHNQQVQDDLRDLRDELFRTAATDSGGTASVALGTRYPERALFVNPAPPSGTLRTTPAANVTVENASAVGETGDYWDGGPRNFSTRGVTYDPVYHVYQRPPTTAYENTVLYNRFRSANRTLTGQRLVRGNRISFVALNGSLGESGSASASVDVEPISAATRTVTVRNETDNVSVVVPTALPADEWERLLADEMGSGDRQRVLAVEDGPRDETVRVVLEPGTYELRLAKVGVGSDASGVEPHYVTDVRGDNASVAEDASQQLVVEVRDRYNNPVSGAEVNATLVSGLSGDTIAAQGETDGENLTDLTTDGEGRVTIRYDAPDDFDGPNGAVEVRASTASVPDDGPAFDPGTRANLSFDLSVVNADGSGLGGGGGGPGGTDGAYRTLWDDSQIDAETGVTCYANDTCRYDRAEGASVTLTAETDPVADDARIDFAANDTGVGAFNVSDRTTNGAGRAQVDLDTSGTGNVTVYTWSGGSGDALAVDIYDSGGGGGGPGNDPPTADFTYSCDDLNCSFDASGSSDPEGNIKGYEWEFGDGTTATGQTANHTYESAGTYAVNMTVTDNSNQSDTATKEVTVSAGVLEPSVQFRLDDLSHVDEDRVRYVASYDVSDTNDSFERVSVVYDNVERGPSATGVNNSTTARGNLQYELGYGADEEWNVTVRVVYTDEAGEEYVAASRSITDTADTLNPGSNDDLAVGDSPAVQSFDVTDRSNPGQGVRYRINYQVAENGNFGSVEGAAIGLGGGGADAETTTASSGEIDLSPGYGRNTEFRVKLLVFDDEGAVVAVRAETDAAD